ncbi:MAG: dihydroorotate dehydrogenase-like protein, partial [Candidatus Thermofonsia bacterium]
HTWLDAHKYESLAELCGKLSQTAVKDPVAFERANYMRVLKTYKT